MFNSRLYNTIASGVLLATLSIPAQAAVVGEIESNDTMATAQNINPYFSLDFNPNIGDYYSNTSTVIPHVSIDGTGNYTHDFYAFRTTGGLAIFDIDFASGFGGLSDSWLNLYDASGTRIAATDDSFTGWGQGGSVSGLDSYLQTTLAAGDYFISVGRYYDNAYVDGSYQLQVSIENHSVPEAGTLALLAMGLAGMGLRKKPTQTYGARVAV